MTQACVATLSEPHRQRPTVDERMAVSGSAEIAICSHEREGQRFPRLLRVNEETYLPLAVSGLGWPEAGIAELLDLADRHSLAGLEIRPDQVRLHSDGGPKLPDALSRLSFLALASRVKLGAGTSEDFDRELDLALHLARTIGASHVRVFPGAEQPDGHVDDAVVVARLVAASQRATLFGLRVALETHDSHCSAASVSQVLDRATTAGADHSGLTVVWDILHTWRVGEAPQESAAFLRDWLPTGWVQLKDAAAPGRLTPVLPGTGAVPILEAVAAAREVRGDTVFSLEWERAWHPEIPDLQQALTALQAILRGVRSS